jgi:hypothetical protein
MLTVRQIEREIETYATSARWSMQEAGDARKVPPVQPSPVG